MISTFMPAQNVSILYLFFSYREFGTIIGIQVASSLSIASLHTTGLEGVGRRAGFTAAMYLVHKLIHDVCI